MKRTLIIQGILALSLLGTISAVVIQGERWSRRVSVAEERLAKVEKLLREVAVPRYPNARVLVTMPDGRQGELPLVQAASGEFQTQERRAMHHWSGPDEWGDTSTGGYFWRYIGSEADRDLYEFVVVFGKRLPAEPDERVNSSVVRYVSFRNAPVTVVSEKDFSIALAP